MQSEPSMGAKQSEPCMHKQSEPCMQRVSQCASGEVAKYLEPAF